MSRKFLTGIILLIVPFPTFGEKPNHLPQRTTVTDTFNFQTWDGNNISTWMSNDGAYSTYRVTGNSGLEWPKGSGKLAVFDGGLWIASGITDSSVEYRASLAYYGSLFLPGPYGSLGDSVNNYIYKLNADDGPGTDDWDFWPVDLGAPWIDYDNDGIYSPAIDEPDFDGDLFYWTIYNDSVQSSFWENFEELGVEVQSSIFGYSDIQPLENVLIIKYLIINKGNLHLDDVYIGVWSDPDIGDATNDLSGSDSLLQVTYSYNAVGGDSRYGNHAPAVGTIILQGPMVPAPGETAHMFGRDIPDHKNLPMMSASAGQKHGPFGPVEEPLGAYYGLQARATATRWGNVQGDYLVNPITGLMTQWAFTGDPVSGEGWLDDVPGDRRQLPGTGPFTLAQGDSQEVVFAVVLANGGAPLLAVPAVKDDIYWIRNSWNTGFQQMGKPYNISLLQPIPEDTESTGPFSFIFDFEQNPGWNTTLADNPVFYYEVNDDLDSIALSPVVIQGENYLSCGIDFPDITGETICKYWLKAETSAGDKFSWPSGAPINYEMFTFGADTSAPFIVHIDSLADVHFNSIFNKYINIQTYDERYTIESAELFWQINNGSINSNSMDYLEIYHAWSSNIGSRDDEIWVGTFSDKATSFGDTVYYWVESTDSSSMNNVSISEKRFFLTKDQYVIGDWEANSRYQYYQACRCASGWSIFNNGYLDIDDTFPNQEIRHNFISFNLNNDFSRDSMVYHFPVDLSNMDQAWLRMHTAFTVDSDDSALVEISTDSIHWDIIDYYVGYIPDIIFHYDLSAYLGNERIFFRFRAVKDSTIVGPMFWLIDDIIVHSDSSFLNIDNEPILPKIFTLHQNFPNPFNPVTTIRYNLPIQAEAKLTIYNVMGQEVDVLLNKTINAGSHAIKWNASNIASGIYFYRLETPTRQITKKLVVLK